MCAFTLLEAAIVEIQRQPARIKVIQPLNVTIPTTRMETIVAPNTIFVKGGKLIRSITNLGHGSAIVAPLYEDGNLHIYII